LPRDVRVAKYMRIRWHRQVAASRHILNIAVTTRMPFAPVSEKRWQNMPKIRQNPGFSAKLYLDGELLKERLTIAIRQTGLTEGPSFQLLADKAAEEHGLFTRFARKQARGNSLSVPPDSLGWFTQYADAILAPWSIDLGPTDLRPQTIDKSGLVGKWTSEADPKESVTFGATKKPGIQLLALAFGPWTEAQFHRARALASAELEPDVHGISHATTGWNCGMGHGDFPFHIHWLALKDGRLVRHLSRGGCNGGSKALKIEFFRRIR
jgi:hypothetical protein